MALGVILGLEAVILAQPYKIVPVFSRNFSRIVKD